MVLRPGTEDQARLIFEKWELNFAVIGQITNTKRMIVTHGGHVVVDLPIDPLAQASPEYGEQERPWTPTPVAREITVDEVAAPKDSLAVLVKLIGSPSLASKRWVWEQYDYMVMADTQGRPGGNAAVVRVHGTNKALAISTDCTPRYCKADPVRGGMQAVAEAWRNITAVGAKPLAITDCMNFGNPERPEIMGQFVGAITGMRKACAMLDFPVVSGNVSLYNETNGSAILPTPVIGGVGLLADSSTAATIAFKAESEVIVVIGETRGHFGQSLYLREIEGIKDGAPPPVDLEAERLNGNFVRDLIETGQVTACHDCSDGGLIVTICEMALASGIGATIQTSSAALPPHAFLFGEDQARYVVTTREASALMAAATRAGVVAKHIGTTGGSAITVDGGPSTEVMVLLAANEAWLPEYMATP